MSRSVLPAVVDPPVTGPAPPPADPVRRAPMGLLVTVVLAGAALRLVGLDHPATLFPDEAYSANVAALPLGEVVGYVRATDPHPPLSYLGQWPVVRLSTAEAALRLPAALCATGALVVMAVWQRWRGLEGLAATALYAILPFAVFFGRQARMYGLLELAGVTVAWAADRWWASTRAGGAPTGGGRGRRWLAVAGTAAVVAAFTHAMGGLALVGLAALPGLRRDRAAWEGRAVAAGGLGVYAAAWLPAALGWRDGSLYEPLTPDSFLVTVNEMVAAVPANRYAVVAFIAAGGAVLAARRAPIGRVWVTGFAVPLVLAAVVSLRVAVFIPKTVVVLGWGVPLALAALPTAVAARAPERLRPAAAGVVTAVVTLLVAPALPVTLRSYERTDALLGRLRSVIAPGDLIVGHPPESVIRWYFVTNPVGPTAPSGEWPDTLAVQVGDGPRSGRAWIVDALFGTPPLTLTQPACAAAQILDGRWQLRCIRVDGAGGATP